MERCLLIDKTDIYKTARKKGFPAGVIEKEYMLTLFLEQIAKQGNRFVFKGGTALSKVYLDYYRISEDLDFTYVGGSIDEARETIHAICKYLNLQIKDENKVRNSYNAAITFVGPLQYKNHIKVDISTRENPVLEPKKMMVKSFYPEIHSFEVTVFDLRELLAEKIRTLMQRSKPRDYFDVWFLLRNRKFDTLEINELVIEKCRCIGIEYNPDMVIPDMESLKQQWKTDLVHLVKELPEFEIVVSELKKELELL